MRRVLTAALAVLLASTAAACGPAKLKRAESEPFHSDLTGGQLKWVYWPGKQGSVALWLVPVEGQEPVITLTCAKNGWKLNARGYMFQSYQGQNGPVMFMDIEGGEAKLHSRVSWAPTGDTPIARGDMKVTRKDLNALAGAQKITFKVAGESHTFDGFGAAGIPFPGACATALGSS